MDKFNYTMLCDFYELTMGNGYFVSGMQEKISYFDLFFRQIPDGGGFAIACGLEQVINYIENLHFDEEDIEFLRSKGIFDEGFLNISRISASQEIYLLCLRARLCSQTSLS